MKFCIYCGAQLDPGDRFCTACGKSTVNSNENIGQQGTNTGASPIPPQPQQYTPPIPPGQTGPQYNYQPNQPGQNIPPQQGYYAGPNPASQGYNSPHQNAGYPSYHPGASSSQNFASPGAPQPRPGGSNQFAQFSHEMNTGNIQKRTGSRGMLLWGIIGLVVLAIIVDGIITALRLKDSSRRNADNPNDKKSSSISIDKDSKKDNGSKTADDNKKADREKSSIKLSDNIKTNAQLSDIAGYWEGTILITRMDGFENIPEEELPPDFDMKAAIAEIMASPSPMEIEFEEDGNWELYIDIMEGMLLGSRDFDGEEYEYSPLIIKKLDNGSFNLEYTEKADEYGNSDEARILLSGSVIEEDGEFSIKGRFLISLTEDGITITEEGEYTVFPQE